MSEKKEVKRMYLVTEALSDADGVLSEKIVEAGSQAQAIRIAVGNRFKAVPATAYDVARIYSKGPQ